MGSTFHVLSGAHVKPPWRNVVATTDTLSFWKCVGRESIWGPRGIIKTGNLWFPLAVIISTNPSLNLKSAWFPSIILFIAAACRTISLILANDLTDRADDIAAGKKRWILTLRAFNAIAIVLGLIACGIGVLVLSSAPISSIGAYLIAFTLGLLHSIRPFRFKERGIMGLISYGLHGVFAYVVVTWFWLGSEWQWLASLSAVIFFEKWVNLHFHQVIDFETDKSRACRTFAVRLGLPRARAALQLAAACASISMVITLGMLICSLGVFGVIVASIGALICLAAEIHIHRAKSAGKQIPSLMQELPGHYLGLAYGVFTILPLILLFRLTLQATSMLLPLVIATLTAWLISQRFIRYRYT